MRRAAALPLAGSFAMALACGRTELEGPPSDADAVGGGIAAGANGGAGASGGMGGIAAGANAGMSVAGTNGGAAVAGSAGGPHQLALVL